MKDGVLERLTGDPTAWATILRHLVPIAGVLLAGWSAVESLLALFLDAWSVLLCLAAVAATVTMRGFAHDDMGLAERANLIGGGVCLFALIGALLGFALLVPATMLLGVVARDDGATVWALLRAPGLYASFAGMLALQTPRWWSLVTRLDDAAARRIVEPEVGFVLSRALFVTMAGLALGVLPSGIAVVAALVAAQVVLACSEIWADRLLLAIGERAAHARSAASGAPAEPGPSQHARRRPARSRRRR